MSQICVNVPGYGEVCWPNGSQYSQPLPAGSNIGDTQVFVPLSNGGVFGITSQAFFPCRSTLDESTWYYTFDPTQGFNDPNSASQYFWRVEQPGPGQGLAPYRNPTVRLLLVTYRDLGNVSVQFTIKGSNDQGQPVQQSTPVTLLGNSPSTQQLFTTQVDILITCQNPQLSVIRQAGAGCLSIIQIVMEGEVEETTP